MLNLKLKTITMLLGFATIFFAILAYGIWSASENVDSKELKVLHVIIRHGVRTPVSTYPKDPYINETLYPTGWGQLTKEGKWQMYEIGQFLRKRYGKFLGTHYDPSEYYAESTDIDRTKNSVQLVNAALWPPKGSQKWGPIEWQPIPVHAQPYAEDSLLLVRRPCPSYDKERERVMNLPKIKQKLKENAALFEELSNLTGNSITDFEGIMDLYNTLYAEENYGLKLPEWTSRFYPDRMIEGTSLSFVLNSYNDRMIRLKGGLLLKKVISDWEKKSKNDSQDRTKALLYGGHDSTIVNILSALKVWQLQIPALASTILLEFSRDVFTNQYGVEIFLRNTTEAPPFQLTIPGCQTFCPLEDLKNLTRDVIPDNWDEECTLEINNEAQNV